MSEENSKRLTLLVRVAEFFDEVQLLEKERDLVVTARGAELISTMCAEYVHIGEGSPDAIKYCSDVAASSIKSGISKSYLVFSDLVRKIEETDHPLVMYSTIMMIAPILYRYLKEEGKI